MATLNNMENRSFHCPVGQCGKLIQLSISAITAHICETHPGVNKNLGYPKTVGFCKDCNSYTRSRHFHCHECSRSQYFRTEADLTAHLKKMHSKWHFEFECKFGDACHGKSGACGFNHITLGLKHITNDEPIPEGVCHYDRPWDEVRCRNNRCRFDHFRGRVKFLIDLKSSSASAPAAPEAAAAADHEQEDADYEQELAEWREAVEEREAERREAERHEELSPRQRAAERRWGLD